MLEALQHPDQLLKSWYMLAFQVPALPETVLRATLATALQRSGLPAFECIGMPRGSGAGVHRSSGGLAWYRAMGAAEARRAARRVRGILPTGAGSTPEVDPHVTVPTTLVWGRRYTALGRRGTRSTAQWVSGPYRLVELDAGHWLPETRPREVVEAILDRVGGASGPATPAAPRRGRRAPRRGPTAERGAALPDPALVVLIGASGSGKSTWAATRYRGPEIVSSSKTNRTSRRQDRHHH